MKLMFFLSGENLELAREEVLAVARPKSYKQYGRILILNSSSFKYSRLAYTKKVFKLVMVSSLKNIIKDVKKVNWQRNYSKSYSVRTHGFSMEKELADIIWYKLKDPQTDLSNPFTPIEFFKEGNKAIAGILLEETGKGFQHRRPHLRKGFHPSSMIPKLARACVNLSGIRPGQKLYDPFCGTGGMLIEAGMIGCRVVGSDLSTAMLGKAKDNLEEAGIKGYRLFEADATSSNVDCHAIVCDPPYGKASALYKKDKRRLYEDFLDNAYSYMKKGTRLVMVLPTTLKFSSPFKKVKTIDYYVHFSMTRRIYIMEKD